MNLKLNYAVASDRGLVRGNNEDSAYAGPHLLALADGMGGHAAGEVASQLMITHLQKLDADPGDNDMAALLAGVADDANRAIAQGVREHPETDGMGTTLTALMFNGHELALCHVGDSRGYRLRAGELEQITTDDTFVQSLVNEGRLDPEEVSTHPQRSLILKAYTGRPVEPTLRSLDAQVGDRLLLCSDGLSDPVTHSTIESCLAEGTPASSAQRLIDLALRSGGPDNVTVIVADIVNGDSSEGPALPTIPATAGALNDEADAPHPDTAAGRAASLTRRPQTITPDGQVHTQPLGDEAKKPAAGAPAPENGSGQRRKWVAIVSLLSVLLVLAGLGFGARHFVKSNYYIAVNERDELVIENGVKYSLLGHDLHSTYQAACLSERGDVQLGEPTDGEDTTPAPAGHSCTRFRLQDLPESARGQVTDGLPSGSYEEVTQQLRALAEEALPPCITSSSKPEPKDPKDPKDPTDTNKDPKESKDQKEHTGGDIPGVNCREVK